MSAGAVVTCFRIVNVGCEGSVSCVLCAGFASSFVNCGDGCVCAVESVFSTPCLFEIDPDARPLEYALLVDNMVLDRFELFEFGLGRVRFAVGRLADLW
jgi:hypothetical protein